MKIKRDIQLAKAKQLEEDYQAKLKKQVIIIIIIIDKYRSEKKSKPMCCFWDTGSDRLRRRRRRWCELMAEWCELMAEWCEFYADAVGVNPFIPRTEQSGPHTELACLSRCGVSNSLRPF
jgi:hypothetical protein